MKWTCCPAPATMHLRPAGYPAARRSLQNANRYYGLLRITSRTTGRKTNVRDQVGRTAEFNQLCKRVVRACSSELSLVWQTMA